jgi:outer membrane lipoprotein-sorting protein
MRFMMIAVAAMLLLSPAVVQACGAAKPSAQATSVDLSAAKKKSIKMTAKKPKEKVEYMRAAPM